MGTIIIIILILFCFLFWTKPYRGTFISIFSSLWVVVFLFYESGHLNLYPIKVSTYIMYLIGLLSFYFAYIFSTSIKIVRQPKKEINKPLRFRFIFIALSLLSVYVLFQRAILAIPFWILGGTDELKSALIVDHALSISFFWDGIYQYVARPMQQVLLIYAMLTIVAKRSDVLIILLAFLTNVLYFIASAAKFSIFAFVVLFIAYFIYYRRDGFLLYLKKNKVLSVVLLFVIISLYVLMSISSEGKVFDSVFVYLCGCLPCSDSALESIDSSPFTYGTVSFNGILAFLKFPCEILGIMPDLRDLADEGFRKMMRFEEAVYISDDIRYNAFISMFSYFYADGGYVGVFFLSSIFGGICQRINYNAFHEPSYRNIAFLFYITSVIVDSLVRFPLFFTTYFMAILYIIFFIPQNRVVLAISGKIKI